MLIVLVLVAVAFRGILLAADPDNDELSGLSVASGESARLIVERGEWFRIDRAAVPAISELQLDEERLVDPEDFDYPPAGPTRAELVTPQGTSLILAAIWKVTGSERYIWLLVLQVLIGGALTVVVAWISAKLFHRPRAAAIAAGLWALSPGLAYYTIIPLYEIWAVYSAVALTALYLVARERDSWRLLVLVGLGVAVATLFRQGLVFLPLAFALAELPSPRRAARTLGIVGAACIVGLIPWTVRSMIEFDQPRPFNGVSGQVLWEALGENPAFGADNSDALTFEMVQEERPGLEYGTPAYDDFLREKAFDAIADHPLDWVALLGERTVDVTISNKTAIPIPLIEAEGAVGAVGSLINRTYPRLLPYVEPALFVLAALSAIGLWLRGYWRPVLFLGAVYVAILITPVFVSGHYWRYVAPALFVLMILSGAGIDAFLERLTAWWRGRRAPATAGSG